MSGVSSARNLGEISSLPPCMLGATEKSQSLTEVKNLKPSFNLMFMYYSYEN